MDETNNTAGRADSSEDQPVPPGSAPEQNVTELIIELAATKDRLLRCLADQENIRRQAQRGREEAVQYAASQFARDLLQTQTIWNALSQACRRRNAQTVLSAVCLRG